MSLVALVAEYWIYAVPPAGAAAGALGIPMALDSRRRRQERKKEETLYDGRTQKEWYDLLISLSPQDYKLLCAVPGGEREKPYAWDPSALLTKAQQKAVENKLFPCPVHTMCSEKHRCGDCNAVLKDSYQINCEQCDRCEYLQDKRAREEELKRHYEAKAKKAKAELSMSGSNVKYNKINDGDFKSTYVYNYGSSTVSIMTPRVSYVHGEKVIKHHMLELSKTEIKEVQRKYGLFQDGKVGPQTKMAIERELAYKNSSSNYNRDGHSTTYFKQGMSGRSSKYTIDEWTDYYNKGLISKETLDEVLVGEILRGRGNGY